MRERASSTRFWRPSVAQLDLALGVVFLVCAVALWIAGELAARKAAIATGGRNIDSGAYEQTFALFIALPAAVVLLLAARANALGRAWGPVLHHVGVGVAILLVVTVGYFVYVS